MKTQKTDLAGVLLIAPSVFEDERGFLLEQYSRDRYVEWGLTGQFVHSCHSHSTRGVIRGLHYQRHKPQAKLITVVQGEIFDVAVDLRPQSPTYGHWFGTHLSSQGWRQIYLPEGLAHGFQVTSESADIVYQCTTPYDANDEAGICWNDPTLDVSWPLPRPILSKRDQQLPRWDSQA